MTSELPPGWTLKRLGDLVEHKSDIVDGPFGSNLKSAHYTESGARVIRLQNIGYGSFVEGDAFISLDHYEALMKHSVQEGDLLFASLGERLPRTCLAPRLEGPAIVKADCIRVRLGQSVDRKFVLLSTLRPEASRWADEALHGLGRPRLGLAAIREFPVPWPSEREQHAIVELLENHLSRLDAALASLAVVSARAAQLRLAILGAFTNPADGHPTTLGAVARWSSGGTPKTGASGFYGGDIPWAVIGDLTEGEVIETAQSITSEGLAASSAKVIEAGTVLLAMYGASIGRTGLAGRPMATNQAIACATVNGAVLHPQYLLRFLQGQKAAFVRAGQGGAQPNISQTIIKAWPFKLPSVETQELAVRRADDYLAHLDAAAKAVTHAERSALATRRSLLHAAFTGQLTKTWREKHDG